MHRVVALLLLALGSGALVAVSPPPAAAERGGFASCGDTVCEAEAHRDDAAEREPPSSPSKPKRECVLVPLDVPLGTEVYDRLGNLVGVADGTGQWFHKACDGAGAEAQFGAVELVFVRRPSLSALREQALKQLPIPTLSLRTSPSSTAYVNAETWLWIDESQWRPASATAAVAGVSVTVTATPTRVSWDMGDGSAPVVCNGPGEPFTPNKRSPCSHVYRGTSRHQAGEAYPVKATVEWAVSWTVTGAPGGGQLRPITTTSGPFNLRVAEIQTERP